MENMFDYECIHTHQWWDFVGNIYGPRHNQHQFTALHATQLQRLTEWYIMQDEITNSTWFSLTKPEFERFCKIQELKKP